MCLVFSLEFDTFSYDRALCMLFFMKGYLVEKVTKLIEETCRHNRAWGTVGQVFIEAAKCLLFSAAFFWFSLRVHLLLLTPNEIRDTSQNVGMASGLHVCY